MEDEFLCITAVSNAGESQADFSGRLSQFWTHMLRDFPDVFERVYAETIEFEKEDDVFTRQYLCEEAAVDVVLEEMKRVGMAHKPVNRNDHWSKYEATPTEWWQIEH
jgi:hypothetical protein